MKTPPVIDYEGSDYQESFWDQGNRAYEDAAEELALKNLLPFGSGHLLELGAGAGRNTHRYKGFNTITLLDYSTTQLQRAQDRLGNSSKFRYIAADVYRLPFAPGVFSAATMIRTLHHLSDPIIALQQINTCLFNGAVFILEFANKRNLKSILRYILQKQDWNPFDREQVEFIKLNFDFHPARVRKQLKQTQFTVQKQLSVSYLRADFFKKILPLSVMRGLEKMIQFSLSWTAYSPSIFLKTQVKNSLDPRKDAAFFRCPACGLSPLADTPPLLECTQCGQEYEVKNGIYDFRME
jgi:ubiquinone/menaquinone biosynthesis C-methylase UbiE